MVKAGSKKRPAVKAEPSAVKTKKQKKVVKEKDENEAPELDLGISDELVSKLKEQTQKVELEAIEKEKKEEGIDQEADEIESTAPREKVKVMRKDSLVTVSTKKTSKTAEKKKAFIPLTTGDKTMSKPRAKTSKLRKAFRSERGVVYLSHIPHGFYEKQMRKFFSQFGAITNLRLGRSKKTGRSKGYAFIEFQYLEVAKIIAETMNNYLMFNRIMKCELVPKERCSRLMFMGKINPLRPPSVAIRRQAKKLHNSEKSEESNLKRTKSVSKKLKSIEKTLAAKGIDFKIEVS